METDQAEYQNILNGLTKSISNIHSENAFDNDQALISHPHNDTDIDQDIMKDISESIHYADLPSETILSDLPVINAPKRTIKKTVSKTVSKPATRNTSKKSILKKSITRTK